MDANQVMRIEIDTTLCRRCGRCRRVCPSAVFGGEQGEVPSVLRPDACIACGHCADVCSGEAIRHDGLSATHQVRRELLPTPESLMELIHARRSNRSFTDAEIPAQALKDILEAARYAPTAENKRLVRLTLIEDDADLQVIEDNVMKFFLHLSGIMMSAPMRPLTKLLLPDLYGEAPELERFERQWRAGRRPCLCNAKAVLVISAPKGSSFGYQDCNLAYQNASLMAESHGVSQVYLGLIQTAFQFMPQGKAERLLHMPKGHRPFALMSLGIPAFRYTRYTER